MGDIMMRRFKWKSYILGLLLTCLSVVTLFAQTVCSESLSLAEDKYQDGLLYQVPELLESCLKSGFNKEEKIRAYRLLTITYLYLDELNHADQSYLSLLRLDPEFRPNPVVDPSELIYLHEKYITTPRFSLTMAKIGINFNIVHTINTYYSDGMGDHWQIFYNDVNGRKGNYRQRTYAMAGFTLGSGLEYGINNRFSVFVEALVNLKRFRIEEDLFGHTTQLTLNENQWMVDVPLTLKYNFPTSKYKPYIYAGVAANFLVYDVINGQSITRSWKTKPNEENIQESRKTEFTSRAININDKRNFFNYSLLFGAGAKYKFGIDFISFDLRYNLGLNDYSVSQNRFDNNQLLWSYQYQDDDFRIDNILFTIGYIKPFYNPRKVRK